MAANATPARRHFRAMRHWPVLVPLVAAAVLAVAAATPPGPILAWLCGIALVGAVVAAVHHAEVVAHRAGEPFGTLVLALAVTTIEVALIVSLIVAGGPEKAALARDSVFSAVMIICNGVVGICLLAGGIRHHEQSFRTEGAGPALAILIALATLSLVLPRFTQSTSDATYTETQLGFAAVASLVLWCVFVFAQTIRHRSYFLPAAGGPDEEIRGPRPSAAAALASFALLAVALVSVVGLAKILSPRIEAAVSAAHLPSTVIGIAIAALVLLPETGAALRAALANRLQTSMNLALGSALATIGLTIPAVAAASILFDIPLVLGLPPKDLVLLLLTFLVGTITLGSGRTSVMQGAVHVAIFAAFLFLAFVP
jgi:Ca2+:H+ antiporter